MQMKKTRIIIAAFAVLIIAASCVFASGVLTNKVEAADENATAEKEWHFYNNDLQKDEDKLNDYDFGPNPILENVSMEKVQEAIKGKKTTDSVKIEDIIKSFKAEDIRENQIERIKKDPKLGAADMAWMDAVAGTRYLGIFYSAAKEQWDQAMNDAADAWIKDSKAYDEAVSRFEKKIRNANKAELRYLDTGINDQMYMEPVGKTEGIPDITVMESDKHSGWFIVYTYIVKETKTIEVAYRIDCGYQPCNVAEIMKIKVKKNPNKPVVVKSASQGPDNDPGSHTGDDDDPDAHTDKPKDKEKGTQVSSNDNKGPGKETNGGDKSSAEKPGNSGEMNHQEYEQAMQENEEAQKSREGGEPNTPSTPTESNTNVDNNGDNGAGNGGIDKETEKSDSIVSAEGPADHWDVDMSQ